MTAADVYFPPRSFRAPQVASRLARSSASTIAPTLSDEAPRFLSAREQKRAEPELVAQPPGSHQIPIRDAADRDLGPEGVPDAEGPRTGVGPEWGAITELELPS